MVYTDFAGIEYNVHTIAYKFDHVFMVETEITPLDSIDVEIPIYTTVTDEIPESTTTIIVPPLVWSEGQRPSTTNSAGNFVTERVWSEDWLSQRSPSHRGGTPLRTELADHNTTFYNDPSSDIDQEFMEFTRAIQSASSKLRHKITKYIKKKPENPNDI